MPKGTHMDPLLVASRDTAVQERDIPDADLREELIQLCDDGLVPQSKWHDRDSALAQVQLGTARTLLMAGCDFTIGANSHGCHWVTILYHGFNFFEVGEKNSDRYYIPTRETLTVAAGRDWYGVR